MAMRALQQCPHLPHSPVSPQFCPHTYSTMAPECLAGLPLVNSFWQSHQGALGVFGAACVCTKAKVLVLCKASGKLLLNKTVFCFPPQKPESKSSVACPCGVSLPEGHTATLVRRHRIFPSLFSEPCVAVPRQGKYKGKTMYSLGCRVLVTTHTP